MCGIAGALYFEEPCSSDPSRIAQRMTDALAHRGPDGQRVIVHRQSGADGKTVVAFGHRRLAIIDLTDRAAQPMASRSRSHLLTFNGEIYNFRALRRELQERGRSFASDSDTEVILQAYDEWGVRGFERLRGMFAFGLWDADRQQLLLVRDRFGIKPLYVARAEGVLLFASEVRALLASGLVPRRLDPTSLWQYLGYQTVPCPRTLIDGVSLVEPGTIVAVGADGVATTTRYWDLLGSAQAGVTSDAPASVRDVRELLAESVDLHLVSDVPVGVFLSGGIDSSAIVALVRAAGRTPATFSVGFAERSFDESPYARLVADRFGANHTHLELSEAALLEALPKALEAMDHPSGDGVNTYVVSRAVHEAGVKVALSGLGGDELFGGYPSFARLHRARRLLAGWGQAPQIVRGAAASVVRAVGSTVTSTKLASVMESDGSIAAAWPVTRQLLSAVERRSLLSATWLARADQGDPYVEHLSRTFAAAPQAGIGAQISYAEALTYMHDVLLRDTDQMSMAHGLEVRVPLLDHRLAEYLMRLPDSVRGLEAGGKPLLVRAMGSELPAEIVTRPKQGFTLPFDPWMRGALRDFCAIRLGPLGLDGRGLFRPRAISRLWEQFLARDRRVTWSRIWTLVALETWLDAHGIA